MADAMATTMASPARSVSRIILRARLAPVLCLLAIYLVLMTLSRLLLLFQARNVISHSLISLSHIFGYGLIHDLMAFSYLLIPVSLYLVLLPNRWARAAWHRWTSELALLMFTYATVFTVAAEWFFWEEFGTRFNFIAVDYLIYTHEVVGNIVESYPLPLILAAILAMSLPLVAACHRTWHNSWSYPSSFTARLIACLLLLLLPAASHLGSERFFPDFSRNKFETELAGNGPQSFMVAFNSNALDYSRFYATENRLAVFSRLQQLLAEPGATFIHPGQDDITRRISKRGAERRPNIVLVLMESMSADYLGSFGNDRGLTPQLDAVAREGIFFRKCFALGTRTVRGLEAVMISLPPLPGQSVVRRAHNDNLFSLAWLCRQRGYDCRFIYSGYGYFDNMNAFCSQNGLTVIDRSSLADSEISFANVWGVCDEDIFARALREADRSAADSHPFFSLVLTTSNHRPYTYPAHRIDIPSGSRREGGVKYADYAIGQFLRQARTHAWFDSTIFVFVADHCASSAGITELPVERYHIPLIIYAPHLYRARTVDAVCSQIDVAPTLAALMNWSYTSKFFGADILAMRPIGERAFISNYQKLGYLADDELVVLSPNQEVRLYDVMLSSCHLEIVYERLLKNGRLTIHSYEDDEGQDDNEEDVFDAIAYCQGADDLYYRGLVRAE